MPYIKKERRALLEPKARPTNPGELNYCITLLVRNYISRHPELNYQGINDILGALEGAKLEFYRRVVAPYEDEKIKENGDVY